MCLSCVELNTEFLLLKVANIILLVVLFLPCLHSDSVMLHSPFLSLPLLSCQFLHHLLVCFFWLQPLIHLQPKNNTFCEEFPYQSLRLGGVAILQMTNFMQQKLELCAVTSHLACVTGRNAKLKPSFEVVEAQRLYGILQYMLNNY